MLFTNAEALIANGCTPQLRQKRADALTICAAAIDAVDPYRVCKSILSSGRLTHETASLDFSSFSNIYLVAFGKASLGMAKAATEALPVRRGVVISPTPALSSMKTVEVFVGGHPLPTQDSLQGTENALALLRQVGAKDCVLVLISGGGSSLLEKPCIPLDDLRKLTEVLLASGATIDELNIVRKHLSYVKGGQLIPLTKATVVALIISDVVNDPFESIASGPTAPDPSTFHDAVAVLKKYNISGRIPASVVEYLSRGLSGAVPETPKPSDPCFARVHNVLVANNTLACHAAATAATNLGYSSVVASTSVTGEARQVGQMLVQKAKENPGCGIAVITGGETTVRVMGKGQGGRNQELVLGAIRELAGTEMVLASCATDGVDGRSPAAGAVADGCSLSRASNARLNPEEYLHRNDSYAFFSPLGDCLLSGPTGTNVMDLHILLQ